jgi:hypothetical protein
VAELRVSGVRLRNPQRFFSRASRLFLMGWLQQLNVLVYLTAAIRTHRRRQVVASLLSKSATP